MKSPRMEMVLEDAPDAPKGQDLNIYMDGVKVARRGYPGTPDAGRWISLVPEIIEIVETPPPTTEELEFDGWVFHRPGKPGRKKKPGTRPGLN